MISDHDTLGPPMIVGTYIHLDHPGFGRNVCGFGAIFRSECLGKIEVRLPLGPICPGTQSGLVTSYICLENENWVSLGRNLGERIALAIVNDRKSLLTIVVVLNSTLASPNQAPSLQGATAVYVVHQALGS